MLLYYFSYFCYIVARVSIRIILGKEKRNAIFRKKLIAPSSFIMKEYTVISKLKLLLEKIQWITKFYLTEVREV